MPRGRRLHRTQAFAARQLVYGNIQSVQGIACIRRRQATWLRLLFSTSLRDEQQFLLARFGVYDVIVLLKTYKPLNEYEYHTCLKAYISRVTSAQANRHSAPPNKQYVFAHDYHSPLILICVHTVQGHEGNDHTQG